MENLINYLLQFGQLNQQQMDLIRQKGKEVYVKKDGYFSEAGKIARQVGFMIDGIMRVCYYNHKGEEITAKSLLQKIERISPLIAEDAITRYLRFMEKYPALTNRIPLSYFASYLGITQSSLSRLRKKI